MEQQFSLSWREFQGNLLNGCSHLLASGDFADVTLAIDGRLLKAHRLVLSICSPFFRRMFHANPCPHPIVVLKDVSFNSMRDLLQFMYNGEVSVKQEDLTSLISTAETLEVKGLTNKSKTQENNNHIPPESPSKHKGGFFSHNGLDRPAETAPREFLDRPNRLAPTKRRAESFSEPEKRVKLREKLILNRHKITSKVPPPPPIVTNESHRIDEPAVNNDTNRTEDEIINKADNIEETPIVNGVHTHDECVPAEKLIEEVKKETQESETDRMKPDEPIIKDSPAPNSNTLTCNNPPAASPRREPDGGVVNPEPSVAPWPVPGPKAPLPFSEHRIVTIPQKEDGKKKYPQKSCRACWKTGRRRDTRFMCEQCCVPLCKLVCFERHQASLDPFSNSKDDSFNTSITN